MPRKSKTPCEDGRITQFSTIKVRLYPDAAQALLFERTFGCCRYIWNQMLSDQQRFYAETGAHFIPTPAKYKNGAPFLKEVDDQALIQEHNKLSQAFRVFFKNPESFGYPNFKRKKDDRDSFTACNHVFGSGPTIYTTRDGIRMTKAGIVRAKFHRRPGPAKVRHSPSPGGQRRQKHQKGRLGAFTGREPSVSGSRSERRSEGME
jgi:putative transposase